MYAVLFVFKADIMKFTCRIVVCSTITVKMVESVMLRGGGGGG